MSVCTTLSVLMFNLIRLRNGYSRTTSTFLDFDDADGDFVSGSRYEHVDLCAIAREWLYQQENFELTFRYLFFFTTCCWRIVSVSMMLSLQRITKEFGRCFLGSYLFLRYTVKGTRLKKIWKQNTLPKYCTHLDSLSEPWDAESVTVPSVSQLEDARNFTTFFVAAWECNDDRLLDRGVVFWRDCSTGMILASQSVWTTQIIEHIDWFYLEMCE